MKRRDLVRHLMSHGCEVRREGARHTVFWNPSARMLSTVPRHREINENLARKICKDLGVPRPADDA